MELLNDTTNEDQPEEESGEPWDDLLGDIEYQEPPEEASDSQNPIARLLGKLRGGKKEQGEDEAEKPKGKSGKRRGLTRGQIIILVILGVFILVVYVVIGMMVLRTLPTATSPVPGQGDDGITITVVTPVGTPQDWTGAGTKSTPQPGVTPSPTEDGYAEEPTPLPTDTPPPDATPTPLAVSTKYDRQIQLNPLDIELRLKRAEELMSVRAYRAAREDYRKARDLDPERAEIYVGLGRANYHLRQWADAESAFGTAIAFNQDLPEAHFGLGLIYYFEGRHEEAMKSFDWAAEINPDFAEAEAWLAISAAQTGNVEEALGAAERALSVDETLPLAYVGRSWARRIQDPPDLEGAQGDLLYAQELAPYDFEVLNALARFYQEYRSERLSEAEQVAQYALNWAKEDLDQARALHTLGRIYLEQGRTEEAKSTLAEAADLATSEGRIVLAGLVADLERALKP